MLRRLRSNLRSRLLAAHLLVIVVGVVSLFLAFSLIAPVLFDRLMAEVTGPQMRAIGHEMSPEAEAAMRELTAHAFSQAMIVALSSAAGAATIAAVLIGVFVSGRIVRPILGMASATRRIAAGRYAERVYSGEPDELGQLAASFNEMATALEAAERRRLDLIGNVAHELRTPIANLQGYLEGMMDGVVEPSGESWAFLLSETTRLRRLVEDLQQLSRAEARQIPIHLRPVSPAKVAQLAVASLGSQFTEKGVHLGASVASNLPQVFADEDRTTQVLANLLGNAFRYTPPGGRVDVLARRQDDSVLFQVRDTGIGVAPEHLPHLFERFYRVDKARTRSAGGSGIGLTIARSLVEVMGGHIWVESPGPGQGATFSFTLPQARTEC